MDLPAVSAIPAIRTSTTSWASSQSSGPRPVLARAFYADVFADLQRPANIARFHLPEPERASLLSGVGPRRRHLCRRNSSLRATLGSTQRPAPRHGHDHHHHVVGDLTLATKAWRWPPSPASRSRSTPPNPVPHPRTHYACSPPGPHRRKPTLTRGHSLLNDVSVPLGTACGSPGGGRRDRALVNPRQGPEPAPRGWLVAGARTWVRSRPAPRQPPSGRAAAGCGTARPPWWDGDGPADRPRLFNVAPSEPGKASILGMLRQQRGPPPGSRR